MGIIKRQGLKFSFFNYIGVAMGAISSIFIYPRNKELYGLFGFLLDTANIIVPFALMGATSICIFYFPEYRDEKKGHNGFVFFLLSICSVGCVFFLLIFLFFKSNIVTFFASKDSDLYSRYIFYIIPIFLLYVFITIFRQYCTNFLRIAIPSALDQMIKFTFPILFVLYIFEKISLDFVIYGIVFNFILYLSFIIFYTHKIKQLHLKPNFEIYKKETLKPLIPFAFYSMIGSAGSVIALRIDTFMIGSMSNLFETGIYHLASLIALNIGIPYAAVASIASPIIAKAWKENNLKEIEMIYKRSSIILTSFGLLCFIGLCFCIEDLFYIMPKGEEMLVAKQAVLIIALTKLFDLLTGVNDIITAYSRHYKFNFWSIIILSLTTIIGNLLLIPKYGITGAAYAIMFSSIIYNLAKYIFIRQIIKISPFIRETWKLLLIGLFCFVVAYFIPNSKSHLFNLCYKAFIISTLYIILLIKYKISTDLNLMFDTYLKRLKS